ncbi:MAG: hypothetical protein ACRYFU_20980 [Janthinobacterium lividum]
MEATRSPYDLETNDAGAEVALGLIEADQGLRDRFIDRSRPDPNYEPHVGYYGRTESAVAAPCHPATLTYPLLRMRPRKPGSKGNDSNSVGIHRNTLVRALLFSALSDPNDSPEMEYAMVWVRSVQIST